MDKPAVIDGCYVDAKFMRGLKVMRVSVDIPIERSNEFLKMFGAPDGVNPVPVAVARLQAGAYAPDVPEKPQPVAEVSIPTTAPVEPKRERKLSEIAALKCRDKEFQRWFCAEHRDILVSMDPVDDGEDLAVYVNHAIKFMLGIDSKSKLDTDAEAAEIFRRVLTSFEFRNQVRA